MLDGRWLFAMPLMIPLVASLTGCAYLTHPATVEPYPHPSVGHRNLPFDAPTIPPPTRTLHGTAPLLVADLDSQAVLPVGCRMQEGEVSWYPLLSGVVIPLYDSGLLENVGSAELDYDTSDMTETLCAELSECGADVVRYQGDIQPRLLDTASAGAAQFVLRGTLLSLEYGRHGYIIAPYDFVHVTAHFRLHRVGDAEPQWQAEVAVGRKLGSGRARDIAAQAVRLLARTLSNEPDFQRALQPREAGR